MDLTNGCWGNVRVCVGTNCGGVCEDAWSQSTMLCENLGCGSAIQSTTKNSNEKSEAIVKSVHTTNQTTNLNQSILVRSHDKDTTCPSNTAYVVCSGNAQIFIYAIIIIQS